MAGVIHGHLVLIGRRVTITSPLAEMKSPTLRLILLHILVFDVINISDRRNMKNYDNTVTQTITSVQSRKVVHIDLPKPYKCRVVSFLSSYIIAGLEPCYTNAME